MPQTTSGSAGERRACMRGAREVRRSCAEGRGKPGSRPARAHAPRAPRPASPPPPPISTRDAWMVPSISSKSLSTCPLGVEVADQLVGEAAEAVLAVAPQPLRVGVPQSLCRHLARRAAAPAGLRRVASSSRYRLAPSSMLRLR